MGVQQRIEILKALKPHAKVLIFDEPTAALDAVSEQLVLNALERLRAGRTLFVIAHRLSTVRQADRIIVLDAGRIAAQGTHDVLLRESALYRSLARNLSGIEAGE